MKRIEQTLEDQLHIEASQNPNSLQSIRQGYQMNAEIMFNDFCRAHNVCSIKEFKLNYEGDRTTVDTNDDGRSNQILLSSEQIKRAALQRM